MIILAQLLNAKIYIFYRKIHQKRPVGSTFCSHVRKRMDYSHVKQYINFQLSIK